MIIKDEAYPQELFARELWNQHLINPFISLKEFKELMKQYNLKPKKGVSISDIKVKVLGRIKYMHGCKYSYLNVEYIDGIFIYQDIQNKIITLKARF